MPGGGKQNGGILMRNERRTRQASMPMVLKKAQKRRPYLGAAPGLRCACRRGYHWVQHEIASQASFALVTTVSIHHKRSQCRSCAPVECTNWIVPILKVT